MMRTNWKKKYIIADAELDIADGIIKGQKNTISVLKGQLTKLRKELHSQPMYKQLVDAARELHDKDVAENRKLNRELTKLRKESAEALELAELLEWAKEQRFEVEIHYTGFTFIRDEDDISSGDSPLLALREAKKIVEGE